MLLKKTSTSLMSTKLIVFGPLFAREILRVDSPVSNIIYVPHVRPPRLPWRKCREIFVGQHMTRHIKKRPQCDPRLGHFPLIQKPFGNFDGEVCCGEEPFPFDAKSICSAVSPKFKMGRQL